MNRYAVFNGPGVTSFETIDKARKYIYEELKKCVSGTPWRIYYDSDVKVSFVNGAHFIMPKRYVGEMKSIKVGGVFGCTYRDARTNNISWVTKDGKLSKAKMKW